MSDLGSQLEQQTKLNEILAARTKLLNDHETALSKQLKIMTSIKGAASTVCDGMGSASECLKDVAENQQEVKDATDEAAASQDSFTASIKKASEESEEYSKRIEDAAKVAGMFGDALSGAASSTFGLIKAGGNLIGTLFNVGKTILSLPLKLWDAFVDASTEVGGGGTEVAQAYEEVRKQFGNLASGSGKQVIDMYKNLKNSGAEASKMGLSLGKVFGTGPGGLAAMIKFTSEMAGSLGSQMGPIMDQIGKDMVKVTYAIKGMGLSAEDSGAAMKFFYNSGQNASQMMQEMGATAAMMAKQSGFNIKTLSKAMVETTQVFPQFAKKGVEGMAKVAHYVHNLGIEVKDLAGVFEKFDSFEGATESASQLSQAFGVQIDAMKMVKESDPTKRLESLRNAFKAAGKDINQMTSAERKLAEQTTGLSGAAFEAAMGEGNKKKALSESEKAAQSATKAAKDQAAAMKELAKSIERIIPPDSQQKFKGFFDAFSKGFTEGAMKSENLRRMFFAIQGVFNQVYLIGKDLGRMFFNLFPGMTDISKGFSEIFNVQKFKQLRTAVKKIFTEFFGELQTDPKAGFQHFIEKMKKAFSDIFGSGGGGGFEKLKQGFEKFTKVMGVILAEAFQKVAELAIEGIQKLIDLIANPKKLSGPAQAAGGMASNLFGPLLEKLKTMGPKLLDALLELGKAIFVKLQPLIAKVATALSTFFAIKFAMNLAMALTAELLKAGIKSIMKKAFAPPPTPTPTPGPPPPPGPGPGPGPINQQRGIIKAIADISLKDIGMATLKLIALAGMVTVGLAAFILGLYLIFKKADPAQVALWGMSIIPLAIAIAILGGTAALIAKVNPSDAMKATEVMAALSLMLMALAIISAVVIPMFDSLQPASIAKFSLIIGEFTIALALLGVIAGVLGKLGAGDAAEGALVIGLIGAILLVLAEFATGIIPMFDGISAGSVGVFALTVGAIAGAILLVSGPVALIAAISKIPGMDPGSIAVATLIIGLIGLVVVALGAIAALALGGLAQLFNEATAKRMILIAQAVGEFADAMSTIGTALLKFGLLALNPFALFAGMGAMLVITTVMTKQIPEMVKNILNAMSGMNAEEVKTKVGVMKDLMAAMDPLVKISVSLNEMVTEMADEDIDDKGITSVLDSLKGAFDAILTSMSTFVKTLITSAAGLNPAGIESAKAIAPVLGSAGTLISALMEPTLEIIKGSKDAAMFSGKLEEIDPEALKKNLTALETTMTNMSGPMSTLLGPGGPVDSLIKTLNTVSFSAAQIESLKALGGIMKEVVDSVKFFIEAFTETTKDEKGQNPKMGMITGLSNSLTQIKTALFDENTGFMTGIVKDLTDPKKFPIDITKADQIKKKAELIGALLSPVKTLADILKEVGTQTPPDGKKPQGFFTSIQTALFGEGGNSDTLKTLLSGIAKAMGGIDEKDAQKIAKLKPFFESFSSLSTAMTSLGKEEIKFENVKTNVNGFTKMIDKEGELAKFVGAMGSDNPIINFPKSIETYSKSIGKIKTLLDDLQKISDVKIGEGGIAGLGTQIDQFSDRIVSADGKITPIAKGSGIVTMLKDLKGLGKISVKHNMPNVTMEVNVSLDTKAVGQSIINVDVSKDNKIRRIALVERNSNPVVG